MARRLTTRIENWVENYIEKYGLRDKDSIVWEIQIVMQPQGVQAMLAMWMPSGLVGMLVSSMTLIESPVMITEPEVEGLVTQSLDALRQARTEALTADQEGKDAVEGVVESD